jgi:YVTN family beta-propeller protein
MRAKSCVSVAALLATFTLVSCIDIHLHNEPANKNGGADLENSGAKAVRPVGAIHLPGNGGFTDYLIISPQEQRLYAGYRTENKLFVVDTQTNSVIASIGDLAKVCSVALVPQLNLGFTSNRGEDKVGVIDLATNKLLR